jgi:uncharacterized OB-fold protein
MAGADDGRPQREFLPFWEGLRAGRISFPKCESCGRFHWYPMKRCPHCKSDRIAWAAVKGDGTLYTFTIVRFPFSPEFRDKLPYVVALVEFPDAPGVRLITELVDVPHEAIRIGMQVKPIPPRADNAYPTVTFTAA